jgi:adenylate cyclase
LQDEIVQKVVGDLRVKIEEAEIERVRHTPTENLTAYDALLRGMEYARRFTKEGNAQARQMFEKAIELDPEYARAYAALGMAYWFAWGSQWSQDPQTLQRARGLVQKALALDGALPEAHAVLGQILVWQREHDQAIAELERAITLDPNYAYGYVNLGNILSIAGRPEEAVEAVKKAMRLNPRYPPLYPWALGQAYCLAGQHEEGIAALKSALARNPDMWFAHGDLATCYIAVGREKEAQAEAAEILRIIPKFSLEIHKQRVPIKDPATLEHHLAALRKAGLK